jgi:uncharacterized membrane-anchored protein YhcB (DUF1043 family)
MLGYFAGGFGAGLLVGMVVIGRLLEQSIAQNQRLLRLLDANDEEQEEQK